jgi:hypothetical protein
LDIQAMTLLSNAMITVLDKQTFTETIIFGGRPVTSQSAMQPAWMGHELALVGRK